MVSIRVCFVPRRESDKLSGSRLADFITKTEEKYKWSKLAPACLNAVGWNGRCAKDPESTLDELFGSDQSGHYQRAKMFLAACQLEATSFAKAALVFGTTDLNPDGFVMRWFLSHGTSTADQMAAILEACRKLVHEFIWELAREIGDGPMPGVGYLVAFSRAALQVLLGGLEQRPGIWKSGETINWTCFLRDVSRCLFRRMGLNAAEDIWA